MSADNEAQIPETGLTNPFLIASQATIALTKAHFEGQGAEACAKEVDAVGKTMRQIYEDCYDRETGDFDLSKTEHIAGPKQERAGKIIELNSRLAGVRAAMDELRKRDQNEHMANSAIERNLEVPGVQSIRFDDEGQVLNSFPGAAPTPAKMFEARLKQETNIELFSEAFRKHCSTLKFGVDQPIFDAEGRTIFSARQDFAGGAGGGIRAAADAESFKTTHWDPDAQREPWWVPMKQTKLQVINLFNQLTTATDVIKYMEETAHSSAAAEKAESDEAPLASYQLTQRETNVRRISHYIPVTEEALEDGTPRSLVRTYLNYVLPLGVWQRLDAQLVNGDGTAPNLGGLLSKALTKQKYSLEGKDGGAAAEQGWNILLDAIMALTDWGSDTPFTVLGSQSPSHIVINPTLWASILKEESASGGYYYGGPAGGLVNSAWGVPVVPTPHLVSTASTNGATGHKYGAIIGDFSPMFSGLWMRHTVRTEVGMVDDDFRRFQLSMRSSVRAAFTVMRAGAFIRLVNPKSDGDHPTG